MRPTEIVGLLIIGGLLLVILWPKSSTNLVSDSTGLEHGRWEPWWWNGFRPRHRVEPRAGPRDVPGPSLPEQHRFGPGGGIQRGGTIDLPAHPLT
jgi:hypothetical protein